MIDHFMRKQNKHHSHKVHINRYFAYRSSAKLQLSDCRDGKQKKSPVYLTF